MPDVLQIPADLTPLLRREAVSEYWLACDSARAVAEWCIDADDRCDLAEFAACRARVADAEDALELLAGDVTTREAWEISLDDRARRRLAAVVIEAIDQVSYRLTENGAAEDEEILDAAELIRRLRELLAELKPEAVAA